MKQKQNNKFVKSNFLVHFFTFANAFADEPMNSCSVKRHEDNIQTINNRTKSTDISMLWRSGVMISIQFNVYDG